MTYHPASYWIDRLRRGWKWCGACGLPAVHPAADAIRCPDCTGEIRWCVSCGAGLERRTIDFCKAKGYRTPTQCWYCKRSATQPHLVHGVKCPAEWHDPGMIVYRSSSVPVR